MNDVKSKGDYKLLLQVPGPEAKKDDSSYIDIDESALPWSAQALRSNEVLIVAEAVVVVGAASHAE
ncbi:hypothetical protein PHALS_02043 [Plasmopara halstedii]|uniref:Uncharacterized protein n=1 Tax=Plasmopara halstedii TaxID=4781 RepID=A0A0P1AVI2_PLAHL|nr:hypothetical protein PHALS_02043 [Plasmopara halstedii]|eukprot:XP_024582138.1 hypothetical protein PHALS_02043 [Plasmopara halstedii]